MTKLSLCPYVVKIKVLFSRTFKSNYIETWHVAQETRVLHDAYKSGPTEDNVNFGLLYILSI